MSFAAVAYFQADFVEGLIGVNLKTMIHGTEAKREISSVPVKKQKKEVYLEHENESLGRIVLGGVDASMEVYIDNVKTDFVGRPIMAPMDQEVTVVVKQAGYLPFTTKVTLTKEEKSARIMIPQLEKARVGLLTTSLNYTAGSVLIYEEAGTEIKRTLPFKDLAIPEGTYQAKVVNPILGTEKKVEFSIEENKKHFLE